MKSAGGIQWSIADAMLFFSHVKFDIAFFDVYDRYDRYQGLRKVSDMQLLEVSRLNQEYGMLVLHKLLLKLLQLVDKFLFLKRDE